MEEGAVSVVFPLMAVGPKAATRAKEGCSLSSLHSLLHHCWLMAPEHRRRYVSRRGWSRNRRAIWTVDTTPATTPTTTTTTLALESIDSPPRPHPRPRPRRSSGCSRFGRGSIRKKCGTCDRSSSRGDVTNKCKHFATCWNWREMAPLGSGALQTLGLQAWVE